MQWYYADAGRQVGPLDDAALDELVRTGVVRDDTLVWREGMATWQPHATARPRPVPQVPPPAPTGVPVSMGFCSECGRQYPSDQFVKVGNASVCPVCRPTYSQGAVSPPPASGTTFHPGQYADWANRAIGYLIDSIFVVVVVVVFYTIMITFFSGAIGFGSVFGSGGTQGIGALGCCCLLALWPAAMIAVGIYNKVHLVSQRGYSIGQGVMKIKIVDAQGRLLTFQTALIRLLAQAGLSFIPILHILDLIWPLWDPQRQTLHDKAVGSFAINNPDAR